MFQAEELLNTSRDKASPFNFL